MRFRGFHAAVLSALSCLLILSIAACSDDVGDSSATPGQAATPFAT